MIVAERMFEVQVIIPDKSGRRALVEQNGVSLPVVYRNGKNIGKGQSRSFHKDLFLPDNRRNIYHIAARTHDQAFEKARKYGRPISVRKLEQDRIFVDIEKILGKQIAYGAANPYENPIAMDEMIWNKRKSIGAERREQNLMRDHLDK